MQAKILPAGNHPALVCAHYRFTHPAILRKPSARLNCPQAKKNNHTTRRKEGNYEKFVSPETTNAPSHGKVCRHVVAA
jgi:hypothetical protein